MSQHAQRLRLFLAALALAATAAAPHAGATDWVVGPSQAAPFNTLNGAVGSASVVNGDRLLLEAGTTTVTTNFAISKTLTIVGQGQGVSILGDLFTTGGTGTNILRLTAANITFENLTIFMGGGVGNPSAGYMFQPQQPGATFRNVEFRGDYARSVIVPTSAGSNNITIEDCRFTGYIGQEAIRESGANWSIRRNEFTYHTYNYGPILWEDAWALSGTVSHNYFATRLGFFDGPDGTGNPLFGRFSTNDGSESAIRINNTNQVSAAGLTIEHNTFDFRDAGATNSGGFTAFPQGIVLSTSATPGGPITIRDNIMRGYTYTPPSFTPVWQPAGGQFGGALEFTHESAHATFSSASFNVGNSGTMNVWVRLYDVTKRNQIVEGPGDSGLEFQFRTNTNGQFYARPNNGGDFIIQNGNAGAGALNTWVCLQYTWDFPTQRMRLYINGTEVGYLANFTPTDITNWLAPVDTTTGVMYVGRDPGDPTRFFNGRMDDLAFFNRALTPAELDAVRLNSAGTAASGDANIQSALVAYWNMDNTSGTTAPGNSGTSIDLVLAGTPTSSAAITMPNDPLVSVENNLFFGNDVNATEAIAPSNFTADPVFVGTGAVPVPFYALQDASPARGAASDGSSIGAWQPNEVFVGETGDDVTGLGTRTQPYESLARGVAAVDADGKVIVLPGTVPGGGAVADKDVTIQGDTRAKAAIVDGGGSGTGLVAAAGIDVAVDDVTFRNFAVGVSAAAGAGSLTIDDAEFINNGIAVAADDGNTVVARRSRFGPSATAHFQARGQFASLDARGSEFHGANAYTAATADGAPFAAPAPDFGNSWFNDEFSYDTADANPGNGIIDGLSKTISAAGSDQSLSSSSVTAQLDRDADGLSDGTEITEGTTLFNVFSSPASAGLPDGADPVGFSLTADTDGDGFVDWYESARRSDADAIAVVPELGDVSPNGVIDLGDAIRALQFINGSVAITPANGDINAANVTGGVVNSLNNPLQILRFQNGSRNSLPAVPGIN